MSEFDGLNALVRDHFKSLYSTPEGTSIAKVIRVENYFLRFVDKEEVSGDELKYVLGAFRKIRALAVMDGL